MMGLSEAQTEVLRTNRFVALEMEHTKGSPPEKGRRICAAVPPESCSVDLEIVAVQPSRRLRDTYIVLLRLLGNMPG